jgi:putative transposase
MPNHFHFVIKVKSKNKIVNEYLKKASTKGSKINELDFVSRFVSRQFSHLFNSYAQTYNKVNHRMGSLFKIGLTGNPLRMKIILKGA